MGMIRYIFWRFYPDPKVNEEYAHIHNVNDPWNEAFITIIKRCGNQFRVRNRFGNEATVHKQSLVAFYRRTSCVPSDEIPPW